MRGDTLNKQQHSILDVKHELAPNACDNVIIVWNANELLLERQDACHKHAYLIILNELAPIHSI